MIGTVDRLFHKRGYGFIAAEDGQDVFVHFSELKKVPKNLHKGTNVEFEVINTPKGREAKNVTILLPETETTLSASKNGQENKKEIKERYKKVKGVVNTVFAERGYGFITAEDGKEVFVHFSDVESLDRFLRDRDQVEFEIIKSPKGWGARNVKILSANTKTTLAVAPDTQISHPAKYHQAERFHQEALAAKDQQNFKLAKMLFDSAIRYTNNPYVFLSYAAMEEQARRASNALRVLEKGIQALPFEGILYENYGMRLRRRGDLNQAANVLRKGLKADPNYAKQLHWSLAVVLADIDDEDSLQEAVLHAKQAKKLGMTLETMRNDIRYKLDLVTGPPLGREAWDFFKAAGFDIRVEMFTNKYADLLISSKQAEFSESYDLQGRILVRCFFGKVIKPDIDRLLRTLRHPPGKYRRFNLKREIGFMILEDSNPWIDFLYRTIEDSREIIIPIDKRVFVRSKPVEENITNALREVMDRWLSRRDLFHDRFPVSGRRFFGREAELHTLMRNIDDGQHVGIYGLRKVGKTSILHQLKHKRPQDFVVYVDLQEMVFAKDCAYLYWKIAHELQKALGEKRTLGRLRGVKLKLGAVSSYRALDRPEDKNAWRFDEDINLLLERLASNEDTVSSKIVLTIDELEWMLPVPGQSAGFRGYAEFFAHMRGIAQRTQGQLVTIITAANPAISEEGTWDGRDNPVFQFYKDMFLPPLPERECNEMIDKLGRGMAVSFEKDSLEYIYSETGGHPYITRQLCSHVVKRNPTRPLLVTRHLVADSIDTFMRDKGDIFKEILDRLDLFPQEKKIFFRIAEGLSEESELATLVSEPIDVALRHLIGYQIVEHKDAHYQIKINLLHRWVQRFLLG